MILPKLAYQTRPKTTQMVSMRGINYSDITSVGDMKYSENISARRYPFITTRMAREEVKRTGETSYNNASSMTSWDELVVVEGTTLYYNGVSVGTVTAGEKQFAVVNTKLVIFPDKVYLDLAASPMVVKNLGATYSHTGATFSTNTITISGATFNTIFNVGDGIEISGCTVKTDNNKTAVITKVEATKLTFADNTFTAATETASITLERKIPDMDYICESDNRLWGCSSEAQTIYASSLGDPTNFFVYEGLSTDAYAVAVGSKGDFTGCCKLSSSVLFWKEATLHKMLGGYPAEYALYAYTMEGLQSGCHKSLQVINEVLFYMGLHGVYAYSGGTPTLVSSNFGEKEFTNAIAGNDGDTYYLSVQEGTKNHLFAYETRNAIWVREDSSRAKDFTRMGKFLYMLASDGKVYKMNTSETFSGDWEIELCPLYGTYKSSNKTSYAFEKKKYSKIIIRLELPKGSWVQPYISVDNEVSKPLNVVKGNWYNTAKLQMMINRGDKINIKLKGHGKCTILGMEWSYLLGGI